MNERFDVRARWGSRMESLEMCANHTLACLRRLSKSDEVLGSGWFKCGKSREEALRNKVDLTAESLKALLLDRRNRKDSDNSAIENLGYRTGRLWNGQEQEAAHVSIHCGAYPSPEVLPGSNYVRLELPNKGQAGDRVIQTGKLREILITVVETWDPDWVRISSTEMDNLIYNEQPYRGQRVGWLTFVSKRYGQLPPLPKEYEITQISHFGNLITITAIPQILKEKCWVGASALPQGRDEKENDQPNTVAVQHFAADLQFYSAPQGISNCAGHGSRG